MAEYKNFAEKSYIPQKVSNGEFYFSYLAAKKFGIELPDIVLEKWYDNMDSSYEFLAASFRHEDEKLAKIAFEKAVNEGGIDIIEILHSDFPHSIFPIYSYEPYIQKAIVSENLNVAFHLALYNNWKTKAEEIANEAFNRKHNILAFDFYSHLHDRDKLFQVAQRMLKIDKIRRPKEWEPTEKDKEKILKKIRNDLGSSICHNIEFDDWEWFMMMYYDKNEIDNRLGFYKFNSDFKESFRKQMVGPP